MVRSREAVPLKDIAVNQAQRTSLEQAIAASQGPIYNLAYRMLGNEADAADATQEVFLTVVRKWERYDPTRPLKPWLWQVALNCIRNFHRGAAARSRRERQACVDHGASPEGGSVEDEDLKRRVHDALARLPAPERALIVLHYYNGLSHGEMGAVLSLPRTTVQWRLARAIERLRGALAVLGCAVSAPAIEAAMRATAPLELPASLAASLSALPAAAGSSVSVAATMQATLGGLIMAKKALAAAIVVCVVLTGGAYVAGKRLGISEMEGAVAAEAAAAAASRQEREGLRAEQQKLSREVRTLRAQLEEQARILAQAARRGDDGAAEKTAGDSATTGDGAAESEVEIDWSKLSALFAERLDLLYDLSEGGGDRQPTKEERRLMAELDGVLQEVLSRARQISDDPFYDPRVLVGMCEAMLIPALGLNEEQEKAVRAALAEVFAQRVEGFDPEAALPAEAYRVRQSFLSGLDEAVGQALDEGQAERWRKVSTLARRFFEGDRDLQAMPSAPAGGAEARVTTVLDQWQRAFSLAEPQSSLIQPLASDFISRADAVLTRYGQLDAAPRQLTPAEKARLQAEVLDLQIEAEKELLRHLTPEQLEALRGRSPTILQFAPGKEHWGDIRRGSQL